jgi:hypothetical protein
MGASPERKLVVKHTFLQIEQKEADGRRRSFTDGAIACHGEACNAASSSSVVAALQAILELHPPSQTTEFPDPISDRAETKGMSPVDSCVSLSGQGAVPLQPLQSRSELAKENARLANENRRLREMVGRPLAEVSQNTIPSASQRKHRGASGGGRPNTTLNLSERIPFAGPQSLPSGSFLAAAMSSQLTTVMLRNLPNQYTRDMLVEMLHSEGFAGKFHFVYLPIDFKTHMGLGYAFVDLITPQEAERARQHFEGFCKWAVTSDKVCSVSWSHADQQGCATHIERYRNSPVMHDAVPDVWKPAFFSGGLRVSFPPPTRKLRVPKIRVLG